MPSSSSRSRRQLSASISAYLTRSWAQSWFHRETWYCVDWKVMSSSRMHSLTKTERLCWLTMDSLSCYEGSGLAFMVTRGFKTKRYSVETFEGLP